MNIKMAKEKIVKSSLFVCAAFSIILVFAIIFYIIYNGSPDIDKFLLNGFNAFSNQARIYHELLPAMSTTLYVSLGATALAVLIGLPCAIYMSEFSDMRLRNITKTSLEVLDGFPSIVIGIVGWEILTVPQSSYSLNSFLYSLGWKGGNGCILFGWLILMIMSFPIIATISEDALRSVPQDLREASLGLGATRWQTTKEVLLPSAKPRILASIMLALAAAMGETVALTFVLGGEFSRLIFASPINLISPLVQSQKLTIIINTNYESMLEGGLRAVPSIYSEAFVLFILIGLVNIIARVLITKQGRQASGGNNQ